jgi:F420-dependent oxidoreductase-like protein
MRFALMTEPQQGIDYQETLAIAQAAEAAGLEGFFRSDHYTSFPGASGLHTTDAWATLAGLARETKRIQLGTLVSPVTFRIPGELAKIVATVDEMSGGRVEVGVGAGWNDDEHAELGLPFPDIKTRVDQMEEELIILRGLWDEPDGWTFEGVHWQVRGSLFRPRYDGSAPRADGRRRPNIIVGGTGKPRSLRIAARYADEYNASGSSPEEVAVINRDLDAACRDVGRDPKTITRSVMAGVLIGRDEADLAAREQAQLDMVGETVGSEWLAARRGRWVTGTFVDARAMVQRFADAGAERLMFQDFIPRDLEHVALMGELIAG